MAAGEARPSAAVAPMLRPPVAAAWRASAERRPSRRWAERCRSLRHRRCCPRPIADYPRALRYDPQPPAVLFVTRRSRRRSTARRVGIVGTRNATASRPRTWRFDLGRDLADAGVRVVSGLAKGIDGAAHRGALRRRHRPVGRSPSSPTASTSPYPREHADAVGRGVPTRAAAVRVAAGHAARGVPVPAAQPHPRRAQRGAGRRREPRAGRLADHGPSRASSARVEVHGRARLGPQPGGGRAPTSCSATARHRSPTSRRRADRARSRHPPHAGTVAFDPRPLPRGLDAVVLDRCRRDPCTLDEVVVELGRCR